ncbi:LOW QUALITY PROTEIN: ornithine decarboxylase antizyme 1-like [Mya arenaria]|uniref:LOW QUALITY PROTEIN: ornithine decarboxylase antizyme 1-like n=1 Tax=Mya arenaria TaxID=6604 RepID=UPI0022DF5444|nr:LOW QUALITY PROTEIN: ornithine decarboxylase antizyme 1-like [Mya arenaria]
MLKASQAIVIDENFGPKAREETPSMPALEATNIGSTERHCIRLGAVPLQCSDVPHAANVSFVTGGSGVGTSKEPPVNVKFTNVDFCTANLTSLTQSASNLCFLIHVAENVVVKWETIFVDGRLYVEIPNSILPDGSKESLVTLLEYAEEVLDCNHVILVFKKNRNDRASLIRTFMFLGFQVVCPGNPIVPMVEDLMFLAYTIEPDSDDDD